MKHWHSIGDIACVARVPVRTNFSAFWRHENWGESKRLLEGGGIREEQNMINPFPPFQSALSEGSMFFLFQVLCDIYVRFGHLLDQLDLAWIEPESFSRAIYEKGAPLRNCWAFIDGTARPICRPVRNQRIMFSGHKRTHCLKFQVFKFYVMLLCTLLIHNWCKYTMNPTTTWTKKIIVLDLLSTYKYHCTESLLFMANCFILLFSQWWLQMV